MIGRFQATSAKRFVDLLQVRNGRPTARRRPARSTRARSARGGGESTQGVASSSQALTETSTKRPTKFALRRPRSAGGRPPCLGRSIYGELAESVKGHLPALHRRALCPRPVSSAAGPSSSATVAGTPSRGRSSIGDGRSRSMLEDAGPAAAASSRMTEGGGVAARGSAFHFHDAQQPRYSNDEKHKKQRQGLDD